MPPNHGRYLELPLSGNSIGLPEASQVRLRFAVRPYLSLLTTILEAFGEDYDRGAPRSWLEQVRRATAGLDVAPVVDAMRVAPAQLLPDFVTPTPTGPLTTTDEDLRRVAATPPEQVREQVAAEYGDQVPTAFEPYLRDPQTSVARFATAAGLVWDAVFAERWEEMRAVLERDIVSHLYMLTADGIESMLARIHHQISLRDDTQKLFGGGRALGERTLWLEPMVCGADAVRYQFTSPTSAELSYAARGVEQFWGAASPSPGAPLRALLGAARAGVAVAIHDPDTTTHLAAELGLSKATVNYHLAALVEAGIADRARFGRSVFYVLTARGRMLVEEFGDPSVR